uniref:Secreted protein n=1 Tax=Ascaris lumbricoides TaxID=6252 RepID=A0A0M3I0X8_ASCLU
MALPDVIFRQCLFLSHLLLSSGHSLRDHTSAAEFHLFMSWCQLLNLYFPNVGLSNLLVLHTVPIDSTRMHLLLQLRYPSGGSGSGDRRWTDNTTTFSGMVLFLLAYVCIYKQNCCKIARLGLFPFDRSSPRVSFGCDSGKSSLVTNF